MHRIERRIGIRELRASLADAIGAAAAGSRIVVTVRDRPVATLGPLSEGTESPSLARLADLGLLRRPHRRRRPAPSPIVPPADVDADRILAEVRDRR